MVCVLCDSPTIIAFAIYFPPPDNPIPNQPVGKSRKIGYALCSDCYKLEDKAERAEAVIRKQFEEIAKKSAS